MTDLVQPKRRFENLVLPGILFLLAWLTFSNTLNHGYAWDDAIVITQNPRTQAGLEGILMQFKFRDRVELADFNGYRPVSLATHNIDLFLFGPSPEAAHRMQVLYFSLLVLVVFWVLRRIFPAYHAWYPFLATVLFLVHPLHVEVVANLKSRDELLALLFGLMALERFVGFMRKGGVMNGALGFLFFLLAVLSKESSVTFLGIFLVSAWLFGASKKERARGLGMFLGQLVFLLVVFFLLTGKAPGASPDENTLGFIENMLVSNSHALDLDPFTRLMNSGHLYLLYLRNFAWPTELVYYSGYNHIPVLTGFSPLGILGILALLAGPIYFGMMGFLKKQKALVFGFFLFFIPLTIYLQVLFLVPDTMADRFMFTSSLGLSWMVVVLLGKVLKLPPEQSPLECLKAGKGKAKGVVGGKKSGALAMLGIVLVATIGFFGLTFQRNAIWKNDLTLFEADLSKLENCGKAHYYLATAIRSQQSTTDNLGTQSLSLERAIKAYKRAIELSPYLFYARLELGELLNQLERDAEALPVLEEAANLFPDHPDPHFYLGRAQYLSGGYSAAIKSFQQALSLRPADQESMELLGRSFDKAGRFQEGIAQMTQFTAQFPQNTMLLDALSDLQYDSNLFPASFATIEKCIALEPQNPFFYKKIIGRYQLQQDDVKAAYFYNLALQRGALQPS